jgi:tight adherence protein B
MTARSSDVGTAALLLVGVAAAVEALKAHRRRYDVKRRVDPVDPVDAERRSLRARSGRRHRRRRAAMERELPALAEAMARELRVGSSLPAALGEAGALAGPVVAGDVDAVRRDLAGGRPLVGALDGWSSRWRSPALDHLIAVMAIGAELGGELAPALDGASDSLRDAFEVADEITSLTTQSRASAWLLTGLPPVAVVGLALIDPSSARFLVASPAGLCCLVVASTLLGLGWWWMRWLADGARA